MNYKMMGRFVGKILLVEAVFMVPAMLISLWEKEYASVWGFFWGIAATAAAAGLLAIFCRGVKNKFYAREVGF